MSSNLSRGNRFRIWLFKGLLAKRHVSVVRFQGQLMDNTEIAKVNSLNFRRFETALTSAFLTNPVATALVINSPGGSPVQSSLLFNRIRALKKRYERDYEREIPTIAFVQDGALSGGYYLACAADKIVADRSSLVGKLDVERREEDLPRGDSLWWHFGSP